MPFCAPGTRSFITPWLGNYSPLGLSPHLLHCPWRVSLGSLGRHFPVTKERLYDKTEFSTLSDNLAGHKSKKLVPCIFKVRLRFRNINKLQSKQTIFRIDYQSEEIIVLTTHKKWRFCFLNIDPSPKKSFLQMFNWINKKSSCEVFNYFFELSINWNENHSWELLND